MCKIAPKLICTSCGFTFTFYKYTYADFEIFDVSNLP